MHELQAGGCKTWRQAEDNLEWSCGKRMSDQTTKQGGCYKPQYMDEINVYTDDPTGWQQLTWIAYTSIILTINYTGWHSCHNPPSLSWLGAGTGLHTPRLGCTSQYHTSENVGSALNWGANSLFALIQQVIQMAAVDLVVARPDVQHAIRLVPVLCQGK